MSTESPADDAGDGRTADTEAAGDGDPVAAGGADVANAGPLRDGVGGDAAGDDPAGDDEGGLGPTQAAEHLLKGASDLGAYIRHQREGARLSLRKLANMAGVSNPYLSQIERGLRNPSAEILQGIARALEISSETLYVRAGLLDEVASDVDLAAAIARAPELTEPQRRALLEMYHSFRRLAAMEAGPEA